MDIGLLMYLERLELMAFFSGYTAIYIIINFLAGREGGRYALIMNRLFRLLPSSYAFCGLLFLGLFLKDMYIEHSLHSLVSLFQFPYLNLIGLLSLLFWIPVINKKSWISLTHSAFFFFFILKDLFAYFAFSVGVEVIQNDLNVFKDSLLLNLGTLLIISIGYYGLRLFQKDRNILSE